MPTSRIPPYRDTSLLFENWRTAGGERPAWGLAWFLAYQFCRRFYASHGIVLHVIAHDGLGYYGIQLDDVSCQINGTTVQTYGRLTMAGDVENWRTGGPGDHGLETTRLCKAGVPTDRLITEAVRFMDLPTRPLHSHARCRHKRWGDSYVLVFEIATILALTRPDIAIWNHPYHTDRHVTALDPKACMHEHLGAFLFVSSATQVLVTGDGRVLDGSGLDLWDAYMHGATPFTLAMLLDERLTGSDTENERIVVRPDREDQQDARGERTRQLYRHVLRLARCNCETPRQVLPVNGIYLFFEQSETVDLDGQCCDRIVRVGTHVKDGRFPTRIRQHYGAHSSFNGNKNGSVFRKHLGGALMRKENQDDSRLPEWLRQNGISDPAMEAQVSQYLRDHFTFVCIAVPESAERLSLEAGLIALLAQYPLAMPSQDWLGQYAAAPEIRRTGLWNTQHVNDVPLTNAQLSRVGELITLTLQGGHHA